MTRNSLPWRIAFLLCAVFLAIGGPQHPRGTMAEMLASPRWVPAHATMLAGFMWLVAGLLFLMRQNLPRTTGRWLRAAAVGAGLQVIEMALHTAAAVDHANLVAGRPTPVLTTHLALAVVIYPLFGVALIGFIVATAREHVLGSPWIAWIGILGAAGHGASAPLVVLFNVPGAGVLFPMLLLFALWLLLTAFWPTRAGVRGSKVVSGDDELVSGP
jgi:nitrate reductase NapE component